MKTKTIKVTAFVLFMMSVGSMTAQARVEREFLHLQALKERKQEELALRQTEVSKPRMTEQATKEDAVSSPCNHK